MSNAQRLLVFAFSLIVFSSCQTDRPTYHFLPEENWMNDPNGPMYYNGIYHLFYQYNPFGDQWGNMHWGHAASDDLVHWKYLPIALYPDKPYDSGGVFSGSVTLTDKGPMILYTGVNPEVQCIALPTDLTDFYLVNWTKISTNPVIPRPPPGLNVNGFRDPTTAWVGIDGFNYILVGSGISGSGGAVFLYKSPDMYNWTYVHEFATEEGTFIAPDNVWECPDFYPHGNGYLFKYSSISTRADTWNVGVYDEEEMTFTTSIKGLYDYGIGAYYASKSFWDQSTSRRILWGWVTENDNWVSQGWAGIQTLPRVVTAGGDGRPRFQVAQEVETLRDSQYTFKGITLTDKVYTVPNIQGNQLELFVNMTHYNTSSSFGINLAVSPTGSEITSLTFTPATGPMNNTDLPGGDYFGFELNSDNAELCEEACEEDNFCMAWTYTRPGLKGPSAWCFLKQSVPGTNPNSDCISGIKSVMQLNRTKSSVTNPVNVNPILYAPYDANGPLNCRIFIDHSIVEIFINDGKYCLTTRIYPSTPENEQQIQLFANDGPATFETQVYTLNAIWL